MRSPSILVLSCLFASAGTTETATLDQSFAKFLDNPQETILETHAQVTESVYKNLSSAFRASMFKLTDTLSGVRDEPGPEVPQLSVEEFDELVIDPATNKTRDGKAWFVKFYAPWCAHCRKFAPDWKKFYNQQKEKLNVARVDCDADATKIICARFNVTSYPTLILMKDDMYYRYGKKEQRRLEQVYAFAL